MSMSIETFGKMIRDLKSIGKDHVFINDDAFVCKRTDGWFSRWQNRVCAFFGCKRNENIAIYDTFFRLIEQTKGLGEEFATAVKAALDKNRYSKGKPLSGRKAVKAISNVLIDNIATNNAARMLALAMRNSGAKNDARNAANGAILGRCIQRAADKFGREVIPCLQFNFGSITGMRTIFIEGILNEYMQLKVKAQEKKIRDNAQAMIQELVQGLSDEKTAEALKDKIIALRSITYWRDDQDQLDFWARSITLKELLEQLDVVHKRLEWRVNPADAEKIIPEIRRSYGDDAIPFAREYMSLPMASEEMLRKTMADLHQQLQVDADQHLQSELDDAPMGKKILALSIPYKTITEFYDTAAQPIDKWMGRILLTKIKKAIDALKHTEMNVA